MVFKDKKYDKIVSKDTLHLLSLIKRLWSSRKLLIKNASLFFAIGCLVAIISPVIYESQTSFVPQITDNTSSSSQNLSNLAELAGIDIGTTESSSLDNYLSPLLYFSIIQSEEFQLDILDEELYYLNNDKIKVRDYILSNSSFSIIAIPSKIFGFLKKYTIGLFIPEIKDEDISKELSSKFNFISEEDYALIKTLKGMFKVEVIKRDGYIKVLAYDKNPFISGQLVELVTKNLQKRIITLRTNKIRNQLKYSEEQYLRKKTEFEEIQRKLAIFRDSNKNISTNLFASQLQILQSEYNLQERLLTSLAGEYNNNKIKLSKNTPIFSVLDEVSIPKEKSKPKRTLIVLLFVIIGILITSLHVLTNNYLKELISHFRTN